MNYFEWLPKDLIIFMMKRHFAPRDSVRFGGTCKKFHGFLPDGILLKHLMIGRDWEKTEADLKYAIETDRTIKLLKNPMKDSERCKICFKNSIHKFCQKDDPEFCKICELMGSHEPNNAWGCLMSPIQCSTCMRKVPRALCDPRGKSCKICGNQENLEGCTICGFGCNNYRTCCDEYYCGTINVSGGFKCYRKDNKLIGTSANCPHNSAKFLVVSAENHIPPMRDSDYNGVVLEGSYKLIMEKFADKWSSRAKCSYCSYCFTTMGNFIECQECLWFPPKFCSDKCKTLLPNGKFEEVSFKMFYLK